jgi:hypothetical protein
MAGFFVANLVGLTIVLLALQFFFDINPFFSQKDTLFKRDFFVITKKVGILGSVSKSSTGFSPQEIEEVKKARFVKELGEFASSQFSVFGGISQQMGGAQGFNTEMFFESVPDNFIDVKSKDWKFSPTDNTIPIIIPKNYLDLYNFGFAEARSMPKISEGLASMVGMDITIMGNGQSMKFRGSIVGFSNRINTILVPESFMGWANSKFGNNKNASPSRLILEVSNVADPQIATFFKDKGYEVEGENQAVGRMAFFMRLIVGIVAGVGVLICALSFAILVLSIYLLLQKNMKKLENLRLMGYSKSAVSRSYEMLSVGINFVVVAGGIAIVAILRKYYVDTIKTVWSDFEQTSILKISLIGIAIFILLSTLNIIIIRRKIK